MTHHCLMHLCRAERDSLERSLFEAQQLAGEAQSARLARQALQGAPLLLPLSTQKGPFNGAQSRCAAATPRAQEGHEHGPGAYVSEWVLPPLSVRCGPLRGLLPALARGSEMGCGHRASLVAPAPMSCPCPCPAPGPDRSQYWVGVQDTHRSGVPSLPAGAASSD